MAQKMRISDFSVNKYKSSIFFVDSHDKSLGLVLFSRDGRVTANIKFFLPNYLCINISVYIFYTTSQLSNLPKLPNIARLAKLCQTYQTTQVNISISLAKYVMFLSDRLA